jgi:hypothetical protein
MLTVIIAIRDQLPYRDSGRDETVPTKVPSQTVQNAYSFSTKIDVNIIIVIFWFYCGGARRR